MSSIHDASVSKHSGNFESFTSGSKGAEFVMFDLNVGKSIPVTGRGGL
jgi:hypothetical protein